MASATEIGSEIERLKQERNLRSPSAPLDAPPPSATVVISDEAYDALVERMDAPTKPNERLRRTMSVRPLPKRQGSARVYPAETPKASRSATSRSRRAR